MEYMPAVVVALVAVSLLGLIWVAWKYRRKITQANSASLIPRLHRAKKSRSGISIRRADDRNRCNPSRQFRPGWNRTFEK
jgi:hypothetical protein